MIVFASGFIVLSALADPFTSPDLLAGWAPWSDDNGPFIYNGAGSDSPIMLPGHSTQRTSLDGAIVELYFEG